jgi:hypothetical protein
MQQVSSRVRAAAFSKESRAVKIFQAVVLLLTLVWVTPSFADTVDLTGTLDQSVPEFGMFKIDITDFTDFSAQTISVPFGISDTELFLFDANGFGVYGNDDQGGSDPLSFALSCLPSAGVSNPCGYSNNGFGPTSDGTYYLAVAYSPDTPLDGIGNPIFQFGSTPILEPTGAGPFASFDGSIYTQPDFDDNRYEIQLSGVSVPEPSSMLQLSPALIVAWLRRKKWFGGNRDSEI